MSQSHIDQSIATLLDQLRQVQQKEVALKQSINVLAGSAGRPALFSESELGTSGTIASLRPDAFYGKPLGDSVKRILEMRDAAGLGPATVREIYDLLIKHQYQFTAANEKNAMDSLRISLGKTQFIHKLPDGSYGLLAWYPNLRQARATDDAGEADDEQQETEEPAAEPKSKTPEAGAPAAQAPEKTERVRVRTRPKGATTDA